MDINRALKEKKRAMERLGDIHRRALHFKKTHQEILNEYIELINSLPKGLPRWVRDELHAVDAYWHGWLHGFKTPTGHQQWLEYCTKIDGKLVSNRSDSPRHYKKAGYEAMDLVERGTDAGFYWIDTDNPYFVGEGK